MPLLIILAPKEPVLTSEELNRFANIFDNAGQVILGVMVLTPLIAKFDTPRTDVVILGLVAMVICWFSSWQFTRKATQTP
jgi:hypothetical protein